MRFYVLVNPKDDQSDAITDCFSVPGFKTGDAPRCSACGGFIGMLPHLPPLRYELATLGSRFGDLAFGGGNNFLVDQRFKDEFLRAGLIGLPRFDPVEIVKVSMRRKIKQPLPTYFAVCPIHSRAAVDRQASGIDGEDPRGCDECRIVDIKRLRRLVLEPGTWSGEDVFVARGLPGTIITSQRFKEFCDRHAFSNCVLIEADRFHFDFFPWELPAGSAGNSRPGPSSSKV